MNQSEAINKVSEIQSLIMSTNKAMVSASAMIIVGLVLLVIPVLEVVLFNIGVSWIESKSLILWLPAIKGISYGLIFFSIFYYFGAKTSSNIHPLILKAFSIDKILLSSFIAFGVGLTLSGNNQLIYPCIFIMLGVFYNLLGKFSNQSLVYVSWSYLLAGLVYMYLLNLGIPNLWIYFMIFQGLSCLYIGLYSLQSEREL